MPKVTNQTDVDEQQSKQDAIYCKRTEKALQIVALRHRLPDLPAWRGRYIVGWMREAELRANDTPYVSALIGQADRFGVPVPTSLRASFNAELKEGARVQLHPASDLWMRGARYGTIVQLSEFSADVKLDNVAKPVSIERSLLRIV